MDARTYTVRWKAHCAAYRTDYIDVYWLHAWDSVTPVEEVVQTFADLVRSGRVRYYGLSNVPAWYLARAATLAQAQGLPAPIALQAQYSLVERQLEQEYVPAAAECGLGITPWSPLAGGFLSGKYTRETAKTGEHGRLSGSNPFGDSKFTEHNWRVLDVLCEVASEVGRSPAQVALAWVLAQPGVTAPIIGASSAAQLHDNLAALDVQLTAEHRQRLDTVSIADPAAFNMKMLKGAVFGGASVEGWRE